MLYLYQPFSLAQVNFYKTGSIQDGITKISTV